MPLSQSEVQRLGEFMQQSGMVGDGPNREGETLLTATTQLIAVVTRLCEMVEFALDRMMVEAGQGPNMVFPKGAAEPGDPETATQEAPARKAAGKKKRGRPSKAEQEAKIKEAEQSEQETANGAAEGNPFDTPAETKPAKNPALDIPEHLKRDKPAPEAEQPDIFGDGETETRPAVSQAELKDILRAYMAKYGESGTAKLTALLEEFGVKRFNELQPEQFGKVAEKARAEMAA